MEFRTIVDIPKAPFTIEPCQKLLFVGSCFADNIGQRAREEKFRATVNPFGVMYNPASVLHTIERLHALDDRAFCDTTVLITLGTNHIYREKDSGKIVDNCQKRPQDLFTEEVLSVADCVGYLRQSLAVLQARQPAVRVILTVSPIRYRKYGYHESQLSKAVLLLAIDQLLHEVREMPAEERPRLCYFPAYEIVLDELRSYRFYKPDMLHPSEQAVEYIWKRFGETFFSDRTHQFLRKWRPVKEALNHRPFNPESEEYKAFLALQKEKMSLLASRYEGFIMS
ncbi:MAG: GSCFA domain-containing protein [Prevotella sp.]|nr:GSCFA domain-containing protein [Prevotella sp.]